MTVPGISGLITARGLCPALLFSYPEAPAFIYAKAEAL